MTPALGGAGHGEEGAGRAAVVAVIVGGRLGDAGVDGPPPQVADEDGGGTVGVGGREVDGGMGALH